MANVQVTSSGALSRANRLVVRSSGGTVYVVVNDGGNIQVFKGNAQPPTSFSEQDASGAPNDADFRQVSAAIDGDDLIHVVYEFEDSSGHGSAENIRHATFRTVDHATSQDVWATINTEVSTLENSEGSFTYVDTVGIAVDSNNDAHIVWVDEIGSMGAGKETIFYANNIGGTFNTKVQVSTKVATEGTMSVLDIMIADPASSVNADRPIVVSESEDGNNAIDVYHGTALNATAFTKATDVTGIFNNSAFTSIAIDSNEKITLVFIEDASVDLMAVEHLNGTTWGTWETPIDINNANNHGPPSIVINGTDRYIFVEHTNNNDIHLWADTGSGFSDITEGDIPEVGTFNEPIAKWSQFHNNESTVQIDYVFEEAAQVRWNKFDLAIPPITITHTTDSLLKKTQTETHTRP